MSTSGRECENAVHRVRNIWCGGLIELPKPKGVTVEIADTRAFSPSFSAVPISVHRLRRLAQLARRAWRHDFAVMVSCISSAGDSRVRARRSFRRALQPRRHDHDGIAEEDQAAGRRPIHRDPVHCPRLLARSSSADPQDEARAFLGGSAISEKYLRAPPAGHGRRGTRTFIPGVRDHGRRRVP